MGNCSKHKKEIAGITDMQELAIMIGDLHYESLSELLQYLSVKLEYDASKDTNGGRLHLAHHLEMCAWNIKLASQRAESAWRISKPYMAE